MDEDELDELEEKLELDYQIGEDIKEKVRPRTRLLPSPLTRARR